MLFPPEYKIVPSFRMVDLVYTKKQTRKLKNKRWCKKYLKKYTKEVPRKDGLLATNLGVVFVHPSIYPECKRLQNDLLRQYGQLYR